MHKKLTISSRSNLWQNNSGTKGLNNIVHDEIQTINNQTIDLTSFDINNAVEKVNPVLWDFVTQITSSVKVRTGHYSDDDDHVRKVRRYFLMPNNVRY